MNRLRTFKLTTMALLFLGVALPLGDAVGQEKTLIRATCRNVGICLGRYRPPGW